MLLIYAGRCENRSRPSGAISSLSNFLVAKSAKLPIRQGNEKPCEDTV